MASVDFTTHFLLVASGSYPVAHDVVHPVPSLLTNLVPLHSVHTDEFVEEHVLQSVMLQVAFYKTLLLLLVVPVVLVVFVVVVAVLVFVVADEVAAAGYSPKALPQFGHAHAPLGQIVRLQGYNVAIA